MRVPRHQPRRRIEGKGAEVVFVSKRSLGPPSPGKEGGEKGEKTTVPFCSRLLLEAGGGLVFESWSRIYLLSYKDL